MVLRDVNVDGVVAVGAADAVNEREVHHLRVLAQPPDVCLVACEACAVDAALLSGADADSLSVLHVAYRVRLCVLQCDERDNEVADSFLGEVLRLCRYVLEQSRVVEAHLVASLLERYAEHLLVLDGSRHVVRVYLYYVICTLALCTENLERLVGEVGGDYAVAHLALDECSCSNVAGVAECHEVAVRAHAVGTACTGIRTCNRRKFHFHVVNEVYLLQRVAKRQTYSGSGRRYVLERCCSGQTCGSLQLLNELPRVERVEEVDVARTTVEYFDGEFAFFHVNA